MMIRQSRPKTIMILTTKSKSSSATVLFCLCFAYVCSGVSGRKVEFLKEILTGRCYYNPPTGIVGSCATVVDYIIAGLEGNLDKGITTSTFSSYFAGANFRPGAPGNQGLFWLKGDEEQANTIIPKGWTTPETTPGGALMDDLNFCGLDLRQDCPRISEASTVFWKNAYKAYAKDVKREVHVVLEEGAYLYPLIEGGIPNLANDVVSVTLYAPDCDSKDVLTVKEAFAGALNQSAMNAPREISCMEDVASLVLCQDPESTSCQCLTSHMLIQIDEGIEDSQVKETAPPSTMITTGSYPMHTKQKGGQTYKILFWMLLIVFSLGFYSLARRQGKMGYQTIPLHASLAVQQ